MTTNRAMSPIADGVDNVTLGVAANLPLYRKRLAAGVDEAEAEVLASTGNTTSCATGRCAT